MAMANYNHDLGEFWEFSDTGCVPVDLSNEAYKFGVNYVDLRDDALIRVHECTVCTMCTLCTDSEGSCCGHD